jgi:hypothetical protein
MKIPKLILPILVVFAIFGGYLLRAAFTKPTTNIEFQGNAVATLDCIVDGVRCKGTAGFFTSLYEQEPGIASIVTYASEYRAVFQYDPAITSPTRIREVMEAPVPLNDGTTQQVFECISMNGQTDIKE